MAISMWGHLCRRHYALWSYLYEDVLSHWLLNVMLVCASLMKKVSRVVPKSYPLGSCYI
jgi:hypothetical protein